MLSENKVTEVVRRGNPVVDPMDLPGPRLTATEMLSLAAHEEAVMTDTKTRVESETREAPGWRGPVIAAAVMAALFVVVGVVAMLAAGDADESAAGSTVPTEATTIPAEAAATAPAPPACPAGSTPDTPGPAGDVRPYWVPSVNQGAVFDVGRTSIVYMDGSGATWAFDVCANTWTREHAAMARFSEYGAGDLVHDTGSGMTVGIEGGSMINVFDPSTGEWSRLYRPISAMARGSIYDPVSGLIVVAYLDWDRTEELRLWGLDVENEEWTELGSLDNVWGNSWMFLIGYSEATDELVFHGGYAPEPGDPLDEAPAGIGPTTVVHSLRTGTTEVLPGGPSVFSAWGAWYPYATGVDGGLIMDESDAGTSTFCRFDAESRTWVECIPGPQDGVFWSDPKLAFDPVNERLVAIYRTGGVWAVDLDTGDWTQLTAAR